MKNSTNNKSESKPSGKLAQILAYFRSLASHEKFFLLVGPLGLFLYFFPGLQELGLYKTFVIISAFVLIEFFARKILRDILKYGEVTRVESYILMALMFGFIIVSGLNLHLDKGLHMDEIWRIDRGRQFVVFNDYDYGNFIGYPIDKALVGFTSLFGIFEQFESIREIELLKTLTNGDLTAFILCMALGVIPSSLIIWHLFPILKKKFSARWAWLGVILLFTSLNFIDYSRTFLSEPLLGYLFSLLFALIILIFDEKDSKKRQYYQNLLIPLFVVTFLTKYTAIIALPVIFYVFCFGQKPEETLSRFKTSAIQAISIFLGFLPYIFTIDGFIALVKGPVRGLISNLRGIIIEDLSSFIPIVVVTIIVVSILLVLFFRYFSKIYMKKVDFFTKYYTQILIVVCFVIFILGFFEADDFISLYHYRNLAVTDLALLIFSSIAVIRLLVSKENRDSSQFKFFAISSVFLLMTSAYLALRITDVFPRHVFPYLFILILLTVFALKSLDEKIKPLKRLKPGFLLLLPILIQVISIAVPFQQHKTWQYEYWRPHSDQETSIKDLAEEIKSEIGSCQSFIFDEATPSWSQYNLGGIAYYYGNGDCSMQPDVEQNPFKRLKVLDFYLRKNRYEQTENPYSLGLYSDLVPLIASREIENFLTDDEIIDEYIRNTSVRYFISRRNLKLDEDQLYEVASGELNYMVKLDSGYNVYEIDRKPEVEEAYKQLQKESVDGKNYQKSNRQMVIEAWKPSIRPDWYDYVSLFEYVATTAPYEIELEGGKKEVNRRWEVVFIDGFGR